MLTRSEGQPVASDGSHAMRHILIKTAHHSDLIILSVKPFPDQPAAQKVPHDHRECMGDPRYYVGRVPAAAWRGITALALGALVPLLMVASTIVGLPPDWAQPLLLRGALVLTIASWRRGAPRRWRRRAQPLHDRLQIEVRRLPSSPSRSSMRKPDQITLVLGASAAVTVA